MKYKVGDVIKARKEMDFFGHFRRFVTVEGIFIISSISPPPWDYTIRLKGFDISWRYHIKENDILGPATYNDITSEHPLTFPDCVYRNGDIVLINNARVVRLENMEDVRYFSCNTKSTIFSSQSQEYNVFSEEIIGYATPEQAFAFRMEE